MNIKFIGLFLVLILGLVGCELQGDTLDNTSGGASGSINKFAVNNGFMYVLNPNAILTYELSDPDHPVLVHQNDTEYGLETIFIYEDAIYIGSVTSLYILDISKPERPIILSKTDRSIEVFDGCDPVVVQGNYAYSTVKVIENICGNINSTSALVVFDVTNKSQPREVGIYPLDQPNGLGLFGDLLFVCDAGTHQVRMFNISNPELVIELEGREIDVRSPIDLIVDGNRMIVSASTFFEIYDLTDIQNITLVGSIRK